MPESDWNATKEVDAAGDVTASNAAVCGVVPSTIGPACGDVEPHLAAEVGVAAGRAGPAIWAAGGPVLEGARQKKRLFGLFSR